MMAGGGFFLDFEPFRRRPSPGTPSTRRLLDGVAV